MNSKILLLLSALAAVAGSFFLTLIVLPDGSSTAGWATTATLLDVPAGYKVTTANYDVSVSRERDGYSVSDASPEKTAFVLWSLREFGDAGSHAFNLVVEKSKNAIWSQLQIIYTAGKSRDVNIYMFRADSGKIQLTGKMRPHAIRIEDVGQNWRIVGSVSIPENASLMQILLYPALGAKGTTGALKIREFNLSEPS